jgi:hypothetical protein
MANVGECLAIAGSAYLPAAEYFQQAFSDHRDVLDGRDLRNSWGGPGRAEGAEGHRAGMAPRRVPGRRVQRAGLAAVELGSANDLSRL